jgi:chromatin remodeling complex protein RSC6
MPVLTVQKPNALQKPLQPSKELAAVVGAEPLPRGEAVSKVWDYIRKHELQNPADRREILADATLEAVFGTKKVTMFEMNKHLARHRLGRRAGPAVPSGARPARREVPGGTAKARGARLRSG